MLDDPHVGERDARTEDRQLLLDALMAAERPADHHLHRQRRAHEPPAPAGGAGRRAARPRRAEGVGHAPPAAAVRPAQLRRGAAPWSFDRVTLEGARALVSVRDAPRAPFLPERRCRRASPGRWSSTISCASSRRPVRAFLRQRLGDQRRRLLRRDRRRAAGRARQPRAVERRRAAARRADGGHRGPRGDPRRDRARRAPARAARPAGGQRDLAGRDAIAAQAQAIVGGRAGLGGRQARGRRAAAHRHGPGCARERAHDDHLLEGQRRATGSRRGCGCWRCARRRYEAATIGRAASRVATRA